MYPPVNSWLQPSTNVTTMLHQRTSRRPVAIERARVERQLREVALQHAARAISDEAYLARVAELRSLADRLDAADGTGVAPDRAVAWLRVIGQTMERADLPAERSDLVHASTSGSSLPGRGS